MSDDLQNYKLQLQQVEAALMTDSDNEELLKLKVDLEEVIELTKDLIKTQLEESVKEASSSSVFYEDDDEVTASLLAAEGHILQTKIKKWKVGDKCMANWGENGQHYSAVIETIGQSGEVTVVFDAYQNRETTTLDQLQEVVKGATSGSKRGAEGDDDDPNSKKGRVHHREYLKKKKQKKQLRYKEIEAEREVEKNKWIAFTSKSSKKAGPKKSSIFASPDNVNGRVGIGTCGMSGKPMTEFSHGEKWRKGV